MEDNNMINNPVDAAEEVDNTTAEESAKEVFKGAINPDDPTDAKSMSNIKQILRNVDQMLQLMQETWASDVREYQIKEEHINQLIKWNSDHRISDEEWKQREDARVAEIAAKIEKVKNAETVIDDTTGATLPNVMIKEGDHLIDTGISVEEVAMLPKSVDDIKAEEYDPLNGINSLTEEAAKEIFGEEHPIICFEHSVTMDRINAAMHDWFAYASVMREYKQVYNAYLELIEMQEDHEIEVLKEDIEKETDPEKKAKKQESIDKYYNRKYLDFLAEPIGDDVIKHIKRVLTDESKVQYLINRTKDRLHQIHASSKFILEISQFEKRFLEEKYWKCNQCLLIYFMRTLVYSNPSNKNDDNRTKAVCMIFAVDAVIQRSWSQDKIDRVMNNIRAFCDQLIDVVPTAPAADDAAEGGLAPA